MPGLLEYRYITRTTESAKKTKYYCLIAGFPSIVPALNTPCGTLKIIFI